MSDQIETHVLAKFDILKKIGSGAYGHVWKVHDKRTHHIHALKKNFDAFSNSTDAQRTYRQVMFLTLLCHPNIVHLHEVIRADNNRDIYLLFEHLDVDLYALIREDILAQKHRKFIFYQVAKALYYLHSAALIHRDLKPSNVLVNQNCQAKLCDFGLIRSLDDAEEPPQALTEYIATRWYRAPQILLGSRRYTRAIDIWSMGCLLAQMQRGRPLFAGTSTLNQLQKVLTWTGSPSEHEISSLKLHAGQEVFKMLGKIRKGNHREMVPQASDQCLNLIEKMLQFDPDKRISVADILAHPYLKEFSQGQLPIAESPIRVAVNDNDRLSLKEYRALIYEEIRKKNKSVLDVNSSTLYRIKQTVRRSSNKKQELLQKATTEQPQPQRKKSFCSRNPVLLGKGRNVKTIEKQWQPIDTRKSTIYHQNQKISNLRAQQKWAHKKRSTTEVNQSKKPRILPSPAQLKHKLLS